MDMREALEALYRRLNRRSLVPPDPLEILYDYPDPADREIAGLVASGLAYGRVASILGGARTVMGLLGPAPSERLRGTSRKGLLDLLRGFRYRFATGGELAALLHGAAGLQAAHGSLGAILAGLHRGGDLTPALEGFATVLLEASGLSSTHLLPRPSGGSACKRLCLYVRWMVRRDDVDPGGWEGLDPADLMVPLDVHMHRAGGLLGFTERSCADWTAVREVTAGFRELAPEDPVRYDFALTRFGIRADMTTEDLAETLSGCLPGPRPQG